MSNPYTIAAVLGGDDRQKLLASMLAAKGVRVKTFGLDVSPIAGLERLDALDGISDAQAVFLPIPYQRQGIIPTSHGGLPTDKLTAYLRPGMHVFLGRGDEQSEEWTKTGVRVTDFLVREDFQVWNAVPSAEGALQIAMANADVTLWRARCLVLGYGRIGKILADRLRHMGSLVTVEARKAGDLAHIEADGHRAVALPKLIEALPKKRFIFNTIPHMILDRQHLAKVDRDALILDLASAPGGVDYEAAWEMGIQAQAELGLPGRLSPRTAAQIVLQASDAAWYEHLDNTQGVG